MQTKVLYRSMTGHSKKLAKEIAAALDAPLLNSKENPDLGAVELLFIVGGIYGGGCHTGLIEFLNRANLSSVKKAVLVTSSAGGKEKQNQTRELLEQKNVEVLDGEFCCHGSFLFVKMGHPNKQEKQAAVDFAKKIKEQIFA